MNGKTDCPIGFAMVLRKGRFSRTVRKKGNNRKFLLFASEIDTKTLEKNTEINIENSKYVVWD
jgi:hypothetical protein